MITILLLIALVAGSVAAAMGWRHRNEQLARLDELTRRLDPAAPARPRRFGDALQQLAWAIDENERAAAVAETTVDRLAHALRRVPIPVVVASPDTAIVHRNDAAVSEQGGEDHTGPIVRSAMSEAIQVSLTGRSEDRRLQLFGPPQRSLRVVGLPLLSGSELLGAVAFVLDESDTERLNAVRRDFVANLSHELKSPIGAVSLLAETLQDETDPEVRQRLLQRVHSEALRIGRLVDDLLGLAQLESSEDDIPLGDLDVEAVVGDAVELVAHAAEQRGSKIVVDLADGLVVSGDRMTLIRALSNLLENAIKYSDDDSEVRIESRFEVSGSVDLAVVDQGIGIPSRHLDRIFERFYRVDRARSRATGGTGLGLSIVKHAADRHSGQVLVASTEGVGSTFTLRLPLAPERPLGGVS
ncbi:MAG: ATP-binding protein [Actinomycetota bacterium]